MAFTTSSSPAEDIIVQEGTFAFDYNASGDVFAGQAVKAAHATGFVAAPGNTTADAVVHGCVGVAAYDQTSEGKAVAVYGPGNIVRAIVSGTGVTVGDVLHATVEGRWTHSDDSPDFYCSGVNAVALQTQGTNDSAALMLLF